MSELLIFGAGYSAIACARQSAGRYDAISGTTRSPDKAGQLSAQGVAPILFAGEATRELSEAVARATHLLVSIAPDKAGDPVLAALGDEIATAPDLRWICYLSTVGVYGDHGGGWIDETTPCRPQSARSVERLAAEQAWKALADAKGLPLAIFRLSGIYGPGRNAFVNIGKGTARRLVKPGQVFNRIHRDDIAGAFDLAAAIEADGDFNITDDEPAPPQDVVALAFRLAGREPPPEIDFETAELSPMARSFYGENKRVSNAKSKQVLGMTYGYPDYRTALARMWNEDSWR